MAITYDEYRKYRAAHPTERAKNIVLALRYAAKPTALKWHTFTGRHFAEAVTERDGFKVRILVDYDETGTNDSVSETDVNTGIRNPDFRWDGDEYSSRGHQRYLELENEYTVKELAEDWNGRYFGMSKGVAWDEARKSLEAEATEFKGDDYVILVFRAVASKNGITLGESSIHGNDMVMEYGAALEKQLDDTDGLEDIIDEAVGEAKQALASLVAV